MAKRIFADHKKQLVKRIKAITAPHLYPSGYIDHKSKNTIPVYAPRKGAWDAEYFSDSLYGGPDAVTDSGFVDAGQGGMNGTPFECVPIEDLETFLGIIERFDFVKNRLGSPQPTESA